jgi:glycosyltransferase involved in cell wall biosynthesis
MDDRSPNRARRIEAAPLRVLYLQPCAAFGGAERQASIVIPDLQREGIDVLPLVGPSETMVRWLEERGISEVIRSDCFPGLWSSPHPLDQLKRLPGYLSCIRALARQVDHLLATRHIDLVLAAMPISWVAATKPARRRGVPVVWRAGGTLVHPLHRPILRFFATLQPPNLLFCCSEAVRQTVAPLVPAPACVIDNGVDLQRFRPELADPMRHRPPGAALVVGCAARVAPEKRPEDFVEMAARLSPRHPEVVFVMAGDGSRRAHCEALIRARGLQGRVRMLGYIEDMRSFFAACDILTLPSRSEGLSNTMLEAMSMGTPLAISDEVADTGGMKDEQEALVFPVGAIDRYAQSVERLITSPALRTALAQRARQRVQRDFDARHSSMQIAQMLRGLVPQPIQAAFMA